MTLNSFTIESLTSETSSSIIVSAFPHLVFFVQTFFLITILERFDAADVWWIFSWNGMTMKFSVVKQKIILMLENINKEKQTKQKFNRIISGKIFVVIYAFVSFRLFHHQPLFYDSFVGKSCYIAQLSQWNVCFCSKITQFWVSQPKKKPLNANKSKCNGIKLS